MPDTRVHAFVLHLARAEKRRANAHDLLERCGLAGEIWPAVDGSTLTSAELSSPVRTHLFDPPYPFPLKSGEIGCFLSHRAIWAEVASRDIDAGMVFEDDATLNTDLFVQAYELARRNIHRCGYIQFQTRPLTGDGRQIDELRGLTLVEPVVAPVRATAQLISKGAAQTLLDGAQVFDRPVDTYVQSHWFTGLRPGVIYPAGVQAISDQLDGSTIQGGRYKLIQKLGREVSRFRYRRGISRLSRHSDAPHCAPAQLETSQ